MNHILTPADVETKAKAAGVTMKDLCSKAGIAPSTFTRWKSGESEPQLSVYRRLVEALDSLPQQAS